MQRSQSQRRRGRSKLDAPHPVDIYVGMRVRERRTEIGVATNRLVAELGVSFQQIQKYERGENRISASRLFHIAKALQVQPHFFFEGYKDARGEGRFAETPVDMPDADLMRRQEAIALLDAFWSVQNPVLRRDLMRVARRLAAGGKL